MNTLLLGALALFFAASLHEDVAIVMAGLFVHKHDIAPVFALAVVYVGSVLNNCLIYGLGMLARRLPGLRRWLINEKVERVRQRIKRDLASTMVVCRFIPGSLSPLILSCGWLGVPFARFALAVAITAAAYVALVSTLVLALGDGVLRHVNEHPWLIAALAAVLVLFLVGRYAMRDRLAGDA